MRDLECHTEPLETMEQMIDMTWLNAYKDHFLTLLRMDVDDTGKRSKNGGREMSKEIIAMIQVRVDGSFVQGNRC